MKIPKIFKKKEKEIICDQDEYCPIYLSYLGKYGENSPEIKLCKNSDKHYCTKYRLIDQTEWKKLDTIEKLEIIKKMSLIDFVEKNNEKS